MIRRIAPALAALMVLATTPAAARELAFKANLGGATASTVTGSKATGQARIVVNIHTNAKSDGETSGDVSPA